VLPKAGDVKQAYHTPVSLNFFKQYLPLVFLPILACFMAENPINTSFRRLRNRYRLVVMNDDTYEEVTTFRLSRLRVYFAISFIFVVLIGLTLALVSFTSLRYLVPGYGKQSAIRELRELKLQTDSMRLALQQRDQYLQSLQKVLRGDTTALRVDTIPLKLPADTGDNLITE